MCVRNEGRFAKVRTRMSRLCPNHVHALQTSLNKLKLLHKRTENKILAQKAELTEFFNFLVTIRCTIKIVIMNDLNSGGKTFLKSPDNIEEFIRVELMKQKL